MRKRLAQPDPSRRPPIPNLFQQLKLTQRARAHNPGLTAHEKVCNCLQIRALELSVVTKDLFGWGGLRDGSGCGNLFGTKTHGLGSRMRNCRKADQKDAILQAPNANRNIELLTLRALADHFIAIGYSYTF